MNLNQLLDTSEHAAFEKSLQAFSDRCVRLHVSQMHSALPFSVTEVPWYSAGRLLCDSSIRPASFLNYATADYYIQDAASLLPLALLNPHPTEKICDLCASPGGKASAIAERLGVDGFLLANESIRSRVDILRYALAKTGNPTFAVSSYDPDDLTRHLSGYFDAVLVDAPCSGQTLVARNKRDDNAFSENQIKHCALRQRRILQSAIQLLKPGGRLIYSTCTFAEEENESQIRWLHEQHPGAWQPIELSALEPWRSKLESGCYRLWPHRDHCAGGFAAGLRLVKDLDLELDEPKIRKGTERAVASSTTKKRTELDKQKSVLDSLHSLGQFTNVSTEWERGYAQCTTAGVSQALKNFPQVTMEPLAVLVESGKHFVPTQGLALLDPKFFAANCSLELEQEQAKRFVGGASIANDFKSIPSNSRIASSWATATWKGRPLGWCKVLSNRLNNHLPPWARITID